ncbi:hypothetical protein [Hypericibacter sp.]|uniref:hypothetical protein n=1 Tax=Hypericibacter sp. TaxID=2705401 RepID=UPI003D6C96E1
MISGLLMLALTSCDRILEAGGSRTAVAADIEFLNADQTPVIDAPVYVTEHIGTNQLVTEVLKTDTRGRVSLKGDYCSPIVVYIRGGGVVVQRETLAPFYRVTVKGGDQPPPDAFAGKPKAEYLGYSRTHTDCG